MLDKKLKFGAVPNITSSSLTEVSRILAIFKADFLQSAAVYS